MDLHLKTGSVDSTKTMQHASSRLKKGVKSRTETASDSRLKKACADFEGIFLNLMLQTMRRSIPDDGVFGKTHQSDMYDTLFLQEISTQLARERGLGIGDALYREVRRRMNETVEKLTSKVDDPLQIKE